MNQFSTYEIEMNLFSGEPPSRAFGIQSGHGRSG